MTINSIKGWNLDNSYAELPSLFFSNILPTPVSMPRLVVFNSELAASIGLEGKQPPSKGDAAIFSGNDIPQGAAPLAQAYAGHQFGYFNRLGDGRAILLAEQITPQGKRMDIQLKGSGRTPYSRGGDGRAALGPMLREYIISEAMHALDIPTTRSLAVVTTGESVIRETELPGAILTRVASSHLRVGTFQYAASVGTMEELRRLADYAIDRHFPELEKEKNSYLSLLQMVIKRQADLIAKWQLVGFIHGVMNTDNMTISGETIDYGPCAFMDSYDPATVFSSIDREGRYAYGNQPSIGAWNLARFAESLLPLLADNEQKALELAQAEISTYGPIYYNNWLNGMRTKLGLFNAEAEDEALIDHLLKIMEKYRADYTNTFRALTFSTFDDASLFKSEEFAQWHKVWQERSARQKESKEDSIALMKNNNPALIPRNHRVEEALEAAVEQGDYSVMEQLLDVLSHPYAHNAQQLKYAVPSGNASYTTYCGT